MRLIFAELRLFCCVVCESRSMVLLGVLLSSSFGNSQVEAANGSPASVAFFTDSSCKSPVLDVSAQGGLINNGTCILMSVNSYSNKYHRLTCGGASGPVYEQFSTSDCSGPADYQFKGTAYSTDTTCVAGTSTYQQNFQGAAMLQCTEVIYKDRISLTYFPDTICNGTKVIGPIYGPPLGACKDSTSYSSNVVASSTTYCSPDSSTILSYKFADNKCSLSAWFSIDSSKASGACSWENRGDSGTWYAKRTCPTSSVAGPTFPPTGNDVSLSYTCSDYYGCKSGCKVTKATRLGQCLDASLPYPNNYISSTKATCTQNGANSALFTYNDRACNGNAISASVKPASISSCQYGSYTSCPSTVADAAQTGGLPAIAIVSYEKNDCKSSTGTFNGASYVPLGCQTDQLWSANATSVSVQYFFSSSPVYSCNGQPSPITNQQPGSWPIDICLNNNYGGSGSWQYTTELSTNANKFKIDVGTATAASTRPAFIGSSASVQLASFNTPSNYAGYSSSNLASCVAEFGKVHSDRVSVTAVSDGMSGSIVTVTIAPSTIATDTTPTAAVAAIVAINGKFQQGNEQTCYDITGLAGSGTNVIPAPVIVYGSTVTFSMTFNFTGTSILVNFPAQTQLTQEMALNAGIDAGRMIFVSAVMDGSKTRVTFQITASTDPSVPTPADALGVLTTKSSSSTMTGIYASAATTDAPQITGPGTLAAASSLAVSTGTFIALAIAAIMLILQQ